MIQSVNCVTDTSHRTYETGWRVYNKFCQQAGIDPFLVTTPSYYVAVVAIYDYKVTIIGAFMSHLAIEQSLSPSTVSTYVQGFRDAFRRLHQGLDVFNHPVLKQLKSAITLDYRAVREHASNFRTLPFTVELVMVLLYHVVNMAIFKEHATYVAAVMSMTMLCRASELVATDANHYTRSRDVIFHLIDMDTNVPFDCEAINACNFGLHQLRGVTTLIRSAKNDQDGEGHKCSFSVVELSKTAVYCVATTMFGWARIARPLPDDPFLSHHGNNQGRWYLTYAVFNDAIKKTAKMAGLDPARFKPHSCRIGGATLLAAAGHPNHYIQSAGRWKSLAFLDYIRWAVSSMNSALASLVNPTVFTNSDMIRLNPGANLPAARVPLV